MNNFKKDKKKFWINLSKMITKFKKKNLYFSNFIFNIIFNVN